jgi:phage terminase small subunit
MDHVVGEEKARIEARKGVSTVPSTKEEERETNPFLRWGSRETQENLKRMFSNLGLDPVSVSATARKLKAQF